MLGLFQEFEEKIEVDFGLKRMRDLLIAHLNKGYVPCWEEIFNELPVMNSAEDIAIVKAYFEKLTKWTFLKEIILHNQASELYFHTPENSQIQTRDGKKNSIQIPLSTEDWQLWLEVISTHFHQNWNVQQPFVSFYGDLFGQKFRLSMVHGSTSPMGISKMVLRSVASTPYPLGAFGEKEILSKLLREKKNLLVAGATASGKTSLLSSLLTQVNEQEHLVILEDTYEIISTLPYQTRFLAGDSKETSLKSYLSYSLRLTPDRIILGEMRSHEVIPFLLAMNTGHKGLMGTIHASSAADALNRVALLFCLYASEANLDYKKVMELVCRNLEYIVFMEQKKVKEVIHILGSENGIPFFESLLNSNDQNELWAQMS